MGKQLIIASSYKTYTTRLVKYLNQKYPDQYEIEIISDLVKLKERIQKQGVEILLMETSFYEEISNFKMVKLPILLEEAPEEELKLKKVKWHLPKYTRMSQMVAYIEAQYEEVERTKPLVYRFYSPTGGTGNTTMALAAALTYLQAGRKVLYFSLEAWDSTALFLKEGGQGLTEKDGLTELEKSWYKHLYQESSTHMLYWKREESSEPYENIDQLSDMIEWIIDQEIAQVVILDLGQSKEWLKEKALKHLDYLVLTLDQKKTTSYKMEQVLERLKALKIEEKKIKLILNQVSITTLVEPIEVIGTIDKGQADEPIAISEQIAAQQSLRLHGLNK